METYSERRVVVYQSVSAKSPTTDSRTESQYRALTGATLGASEARW